MSQISRPFQIMLLVVGVLALVWLFVLQGHPSTTSTSSTAPVVSAAAPAPPSAAAEAQAAAAPSKVYHGAAPGVEGLTKAINRAHGAVATSQKYDKSIEQKSTQAAGETVPTATSPTYTSPATSTAATPSHRAQHTPSHPASSVAGATKGASVHKAAPSHIGKTRSGTVGSTPTTKKSSGATRQTAKSSVPKGQRTIEKQLAAGNVVALLFWNHEGASDVAVKAELKLLVEVHRKLKPYIGKPEVKKLLKEFGLELDKKIAMDVANPAQVAEYGTITRGVQVYDTPTLLIVNKQGQTIVMNGLQDAYSIEQTIDEARNNS